MFLDIFCIHVFVLESSRVMNNKNINCCEKNCSCTNAVYNFAVSWMLLFIEVLYNSLQGLNYLQRWTYFVSLNVDLRCYFWGTKSCLPCRPPMLNHRGGTVCPSHLTLERYIEFVIDLKSSTANVCGPYNILEPYKASFIQQFMSRNFISDVYLNWTLCAKRLNIKPY